MGLVLLFILRPSLTVSRLDGTGTNPSIFDTSTGKGFKITNNTTGNVYLQTSATDFDTIGAGDTSISYTEYGSYYLRDNNKVDAGVYLTITAVQSDGSFSVDSGTVSGSFAVTSNFA